MTTVRNLHDQAMELAQQALIARSRREWEQAEALAQAALSFEVQAADLIADDPKSEPTRSILYRSAASLAYQAKDYITAQRLIAKGLSGFPPAHVEQELKDLYEQVNFERHLEVRGVELEEDDLQIAMQGSAVGFGTIIYSEFKRRVELTTKLMDRTVQRLLGAKYQSSGRPSQNIRPFIPTLSKPREGSFAITIRLALAKGQTAPLFLNASQVYEEIILGMSMLNENDLEGLKNLIKEPDYFRNFVYLGRDIAPDGRGINFVGFTSNRGRTGLTTLRSNIIEPEPEVEDQNESESEPIEIEGMLDFATVRKSQERLGLTTSEGKEYFIIVQTGMDDLVRTYFRQNVIVRGLLQKAANNITAADIQPISDLR